MRKSARPSQILDGFHKGFVYGCLGLTAYGFYIGGTRFYHYIVYTRPAQAQAKQQLIKAAEEELES